MGVSFRVGADGHDHGIDRDIKPAVRYFNRTAAAGGIRRAAEFGRVGAIVPEDAPLEPTGQAPGPVGLRPPVPSSGSRP